MSRGKNPYDNDDDPECEDGWERRPDETDEDYQERMDDWNDMVEHDFDND